MASKWYRCTFVGQTKVIIYKQVYACKWFILRQTGFFVLKKMLWVWILRDMYLFWICLVEQQSQKTQMSKSGVPPISPPFWVTTIWIPKVLLVSHGGTRLKIKTPYHVLWQGWYVVLGIKPCGLSSRIRDVGKFWYKTEIKIIFCAIIVFDCVCLYGLPISKIEYKKFRVRVNHTIGHNQKT